MPADFAERRGREESGRPRAAREMLLDALAVLEQEKVLQRFELFSSCHWSTGDPAGLEM